MILLELYSGRRVWKGFSYMQILAAISAGAQRGGVGRFVRCAWLVATGCEACTAAR